MIARIAELEKKIELLEAVSTKAKSPAVDSEFPSTPSNNDSAAAGAGNALSSDSSRSLQGRPSATINSTHSTIKQKLDSFGFPATMVCLAIIVALLGIVIAYRNV